MTGHQGDRLRTLAARLCAPQTLERVIDPLLADFHVEMRDAAGQPWKRGYLRLVTGAAFVKVVVLCGCHRVTRWHSASHETSALARTAWASLVAVLGTQTLFMLPPLLHQPATWPAVISLVPQAVPLAFPIGLTVGILYGLRRSSVSRRMRRAVVVAATICSVASFVTMAWVLPAGNRAFRERVYFQLRANPDDFPVRKLRKGLNELTIVELRQQLRGSFDDERVRRHAALSYYERWALPSATITLALFALSVVSLWRLPQLVVWIVAGSTFWAYYILIVAGREYALGGTVPPAIAALLPNLVLALAITLLNVVPRRADAAAAGVEP
jgi:lipopolysaccharide export LptBFGC system permease protein LptF